jgi:hypothetical protein
MKITYPIKQFKYFSLFLLMFLVSLLLPLEYKVVIGVAVPPGVFAHAYDKIDIVPIIQAFGILVTATGAISSLLIMWRLDRRQVDEFILKEKEYALKEKEYALKLAELESKLADLKPITEAGQKTDPP